MMETILVWNVRGIHSSRRRLLSLVRKHKVHVLVLSEPFMDESQLQRVAYSLGFGNFYSNEAVGGKIG